MFITPRVDSCEWSFVFKYDCKAIPIYGMQSNEKLCRTCRRKCFETLLRKTNKMTVFVIWNCRITNLLILSMMLSHITVLFFVWSEKSKSVIRKKLKLWRW